jgi:peroxiredoxin
MFKKTLLFLSLIGLVGWGIYTFGFSVKGNQVAVGEKAPDFQLQTLDGKDIKLSELEGQPVIINFWATWCTPCKKEMPDLQGLYDSNEGSHIEILAINMTTMESDGEKVREFSDELGLTFPLLLDKDGDVEKTYQVITIPTTYIIDSKGIIREKIVGPMDKEILKGTMNDID